MAVLICTVCLFLPSIALPQPGFLDWLGTSWVSVVTGRICGALVIGSCGGSAGGLQGGSHFLGLLPALNHVESVASRS